MSCIQHYNPALSCLSSVLFEHVRATTLCPTMRSRQSRVIVVAVLEVPAQHGQTADSTLPIASDARRYRRGVPCMAVRPASLAVPPPSPPRPLSQETPRREYGSWWRR